MEGAVTSGEGGRVGYRPQQGRNHLTAQPASAVTSPMPRPVVVVITVLIPFGCGFYLSYLVRTVNAVISPYLVSEIGLTQGNLGFLTGVYFITFAAMQLPLGVLLDRFGPRRVQTVLLVLAALGTGLFAVGDSFVVLCLARGLVGIGVAGCLMASFKANAIWWPRDRLPLMNNVIAAFGSFGALSATVPVQVFLQFADWRALFAVLAAVILALAAVIWFVVPERAGSLDTSARMRTQFAAFGAILVNGFFWRISFLLMVGQAGYLAYQTLWAGPWLRVVGGFDEDGTVFRLLLIQAAMFGGVLTFGTLADRLRHTRIRPRSIVAGAIAVYIAAQISLALGVTQLAGLLWVVFGFFGPVTFLCFAIFSERFPETQVGRVATAANLLIFVCAFVAQWGVGVIIDLFSTRGLVAGHMTALLVVAAFQLASLVIFIWPERRVSG